MPLTEKFENSNLYSVINKFIQSPSYKEELVKEEPYDCLLEDASSLDEFEVTRSGNTQLLYVYPTMNTDTYVFLSVRYTEDEQVIEAHLTEGVITNDSEPYGYEWLFDSSGTITEEGSWTSDSAIHEDISITIGNRAYKL